MGLICNKVIKLCALCKHKETCKEDMKHEIKTLESIKGRFFVDGKEVSAMNVPNAVSLLITLINSVGSVVTNSNHSPSMSNSVKSWQTKHRRK
jgi:hypothetical protein|nr:MAG TPA: hypothetical protein [Caudoviricetes sp.]